MSKLKELGAVGQSVWLDFIRRDMVSNGELAALVDEGVTGVTSNPSIFEAAIAGTDLYDETIAVADGDPLAVFESLAIEDVQGAADLLRGVYDATDGLDGYVSLEVSPTLADDAEGTIADAHRLWDRVNRPNLMIKVPATPAGDRGDRRADRRRHQRQCDPDVQPRRLRGRRDGIRARS